MPDRALLLCAVMATTTLVAPRPLRADDGEDAASEPSESRDEDDSRHQEKQTHEQDPEGYQGSVQFSMTSTLASYSELSFTLNRVPVYDLMGVPQVDANGQQLTFDTTGTLTNTAWGPSTNSVTFELSYGVSNRALIGGLLEIGGSTLNTKIAQLNIDDKLALARFLVGPRFEFMFSTSGKVRPFALGVAGFTWAPQQAAERSISLTGFQLLGGVGLHFQLAPSFSIDPAVRVGGGYGVGKVNQPLYGKIDAHGSLVTASVLVGATGWLL